MAQDTHLTVVFLHQVEAGQPFFCALADRRAWIRLSPAGQAHPPATEVPVQRDGISAHMNGMLQVWVRDDRLHR
jgi:hypothetical protein